MKIRYLLLLPLTTMSLATEVTPKIVGGEDAVQDYPWMAGLHEYIPATGEYYVEPFCGGSLIAPGWVVSAAHCFTDPGSGGNPSSYSPPADELIVRLDSPDLSDDPEHLVQRIIAHPQYGVADGSDDSDIVLIQLSSKTVFDTVSLANNAIMSELESSSLLDDVVQAIGWGVYDGEGFTVIKGAASGDQPDFLQIVALDYLPFSEKKCRTAWDGLTTNMICAWEPQPDADDTFGEDACFGDSGGPLLLPENTLLSSGRTSHEWLLGATSFGSVACNSIKTPGIYTRMASFESWIEGTTANAGDALVDVVATLDQPAAARPAQAFNFDVGIANNSKLNSASDAIFEVTAANTTLTPVNATGCSNIANGWRCNVATLTAGQQVQRTFTATWLGADDSSLQTDLQVFANQDDYRIGNNTVSATTDVTFLPDPFLTAPVVNRNRDGRASITVTAGNLSSINSVTDATVIVELPNDLGATGYPPCELAEAPSRFICDLGTLDPEDEVLLDFDLKGVGTFLLPITLQSTGDIHPGDTSKTLEITLKRSSDSGSALPLVALMLLLYRRRNWRNQPSN
ncbi:trypsin-like serine protease [Alcanivorax sp. 1008]|uniref:S1 family peptidase n=1 Tax=Alcanivorax sp. 1008 TaxID=2816853 RepID=UPI001D968D20|nr:serine protease [Alcanivorax sp. 1008]MCC1495460.1 serine protease [Alcanivorax sp. 1008]